MTNEEKATQYAYDYDMVIAGDIQRAYYDACEWKDQQFKEYLEKKYEDDENNRKKPTAKEWELTQKIVYCSFGIYIKGLYHRIQKRFGRISYYKGEHSNFLTWSKYPKQLQFVNHRKSKSLYFMRENDEWTWCTWFRKDGKWGFKRDKRENDHTCCEANINTDDIWKDTKRYDKQNL